MPNLEKGPEIVDLTGPEPAGFAQVVVKPCPPPLPGMSQKVEEEAPEPHRLKPGQYFMGKVVPGPPGRRNARRRRRVNYNTLKYCMMSHRAGST